MEMCTHSMASFFGGLEVVIMNVGEGQLEKKQKN